MVRVKRSICAVWMCLGVVGTAVATDMPAKRTSETIDGVAIMPGVERLSYVSPRFFGVRKSYDDCVATAQEHVRAQGECADSEFKYQDARLNRAYKALMSDVASDAIARDALQGAQRAWLIFFQKDCEARAGRFGSNDAPATLSMCRMESTALRAQQLEDWLGSLSVRH